MKTTAISITALFFLIFNAFLQQPDYARLKAEAEAQYAQGSYARANETYARVDKSKLNATELRWVEFRLADTSWRAQNGSETSDDTKYEQAQKQLEELVRAADKTEDRDLVWAEAHESLADLFWTRKGVMNWGVAWPHYQQALDWWAGQRELDRARDRYLKIVFKAAEPPNQNEYFVYSYYGNYIPLDILENALKISTIANDKAHLHYLIAMTMRANGGGTPSVLQRVPDEFEEALTGGRQNDWYDDALFHYAQWMNNAGTIRSLGDGEWRQQPDYAKALELLRRLVREYAKGETRYFDQALALIKEITDPTISVGVGNTFMPGSEIEFELAARNVRRVDFALYKFDMTRDVRFARSSDDDEGDVEGGSWLQKLALNGPPAKAWSKNIDSQEPHQPFSGEIRVEGKLPAGAYLLEAKSGSLSSRELVLVTDATLVIKSSLRQGLVFFADAITGAPIPNANVVLWEQYALLNKWHWRRSRQTTNS
ncbi:MAG TPA: hypothetical protein VGK82_10355, partial [Pyrinomonadaceae bacterium]